MAVIPLRRFLFHKSRQEHTELRSAMRRILCLFEGLQVDQHVAFAAASDRGAYLALLLEG